MPELPEVETLRRALLPLIQNKPLLHLKFFRRDLRFPVPEKTLRREVLNQRVSEITREGKYLLLHTSGGAMLWHLGMSGRVIQRPSMEPVEKHTHAVFHFETETFLHYVDPRRFGCILWVPQDEGHPLIDHLGPDPFSAQLTAKVLKEKARNRKITIKSFLMDSRLLAGVGNIYACESLFDAGLNPKRHAGRLTLAEWERLLTALRKTLRNSIASGGTTLRDFFNPDGTEGYYALNLSVYGKENQPCPNCSAPITRIPQTARSTFYCKMCQKR